MRDKKFITKEGKFDKSAWYKNYRKTHKKERDEYQKQWHKEHPNYQAGRTEKFNKKFPNYAKEYRKRNLEIRRVKRRLSGQSNAGTSVLEAIKKGKLLSLSKNYIKCTYCDYRSTEYDHRDYNYPLIVQPVCHSCNLRLGKAIPLKNKKTQYHLKGIGGRPSKEMKEMQKKPLSFLMKPNQSLPNYVEKICKTPMKTGTECSETGLK